MWISRTKTRFKRYPMEIIILGGSKTVYFLTKQFIRRKYNVTVIHSDRERARELAEQTKATVVLGDGTAVSMLEESGARRAEVLLALSDNDHDNLIACQIAQRKFGVPRVLAVVNDPDNEVVFRKLGIDVVFSTTRVIGAIIEQKTSFSDITALMPLARGRLTITDVHIQSDTPSVGKALSELNLSEGTLVACIIRDDDVILARGNTRIIADDHLVLISHPEKQPSDLLVLCGEQD